MRNFNKRIFLFLFSLITCYCCFGKDLKVADMLYLPTDRAATDSLTMCRDRNGDICAIVKLPFPKVEESVISGDQILKKEYHGNEWYIYMPQETYIFYIKYPGYEDLTIDLSEKFPNGVESGKTYKVIVPYDDDIHSVQPPHYNESISTKTIGNISSNINNNFPDAISQTISRTPLLKNNCAYFQIGYSFLGLTGLNIGAGGYISNFNIEANFLIGFSKSEDIYWNDSSGDFLPVNATYSPMAFDFKIGYGIIIGTRFRLTPRIGIQYTALSESSDKKYANNANAMSVPVSLKAELAIIKHFGISLEPSYIINASKSEGYKVLSEISNKIKGYADGFGINISLNCNF